VTEVSLVVALTDFGELLVGDGVCLYRDGEMTSHQFFMEITLVSLGVAGWRKSGGTEGLLSDLVLVTGILVVTLAGG
jgi:hypothetical protein